MPSEEEEQEQDRRARKTEARLMRSPARTVSSRRTTRAPSSSDNIETERTALVLGVQSVSLARPEH